MDKKNTKPEDRSVIVVNNFFKYLKEKGISNSQYAKDNFIDKSLLTQWKNGTTRMTMEHIYNASKYFGVTVNDLMYDDEEKKCIEVLEDKNYSPITALKHEEVKIIDFSDFGFTVVFSIISKIILFGLLFLLKKHQTLTLIVIFILLAIDIFFPRLFNVRKTVYVINYLDDIYYKIDNPVNDYRKYHIIIFIISMITNFSSLIIMLLKPLMYTNLSILKLPIIILFVLIFITSVYTTVRCSDNPKELKDEVYPFELDGYNISIWWFLLSVGLIFIFLYISFVGKYFIWSVLILLCCQTVLSFINMLLVYKKYKNFYLVYNEGGKKEHRLYKNDVE